MVSTAIVSGTLGAMSVIRGGVAGTAAGVKGVQDSGSSLKSRAGLAGVFGGMGRGVGMGVGSAMMSDTSVGVSQMGPSSGSVGSPFAKHGGAILGHAGNGGDEGDDDDDSSSRKGRRGREQGPKGAAMSNDGERGAIKTKTKTKTQKATATDTSASDASSATPKIVSPIIPPMIKPETTTTATKIPSTSDTYSESSSTHTLPKPQNNSGSPESSSSHTGTPKTDDSLDLESDLFTRKNPSPAIHKDQNNSDGDLSEQAGARKDHIHDIHTEFNRPRKK